jgi:transposase-like protein
MYDADVSPSLISKVTDSVSEQVIAWQNRPLNEIYPIIYLDCIVVKIRQDNQVINKQPRRKRRGIKELRITSFV